MLVVACGTAQFSDAEIRDALADMKPSDPGIPWGEWVVNCALENGFSAELSIDGQGSVGYGEHSTLDGQIMEQCTAQADDLYVFPEIDAERLEDAAMYELQTRAAECVETELGLDPQLPTLEFYVESGGDWNVYDNLEPSGEEEWNRWNATCPQDLWTYYDE
jgi:hypothetical protein